MERFCYFGDTIGTRGDVFGSVITRNKRRWCKFRYLVRLLASRGFPLGVKGRLYFAYVRSFMLYESETWPVKEEDVVRLGGVMQGWLVGCATLDLRIGFLRTLGLD